MNATNLHQCGLNAHSAKPVSNQFESSLQCEHAFILETACMYMYTSTFSFVSFVQATRLSKGLSRVTIRMSHCGWATQGDMDFGTLSVPLKYM